MRAVIIAGGSMRDYAYIRRFIEPGDYIIAADSGYRHAMALGVEPRVLLGDFDSLDTLPEGVETIRHPAKKNQTDSELAMNWAKEQGASHILLLGAIGTRMDHTLSNILLLTQLLDRGVTGEIIDEHNHIWLTDGALTIGGEAGQFLSLLPLETCEGVHIRNAAYPLENATLQVGHSLGVSNAITASPVEISLRKGRLLVMSALTMLMA